MGCEFYTVFFWIASAIGLLLPAALSHESRMESIDCRQPNYEELKPEANLPAKWAREIFNRLVVSEDFRPLPGDIGQQWKNRTGTRFFVPTAEG